MTTGTGYSAEVESARAHLTSGNLGAAGYIADQLLTRDPQDAGALCIRAALALLQADYEAALGLSCAAQPLAPHDHWPLRISAASLAYLGRHDEAVAAADAAIRLARTDERTLLARVQVDLICRRCDQGTVILAREAVRFAPNSAEAHRWLASTLRVRGELHAAAKAAHHALRLQPGHPGATNELSIIAEWRERSGADVGGMEPADRERAYSIFRLLPDTLAHQRFVALLAVLVSTFAVPYRGVADLRLVAGLSAVGGVVGTAALVARLYAIGGPRTVPIVRSLLKDDALRMWSAAAGVLAIVLVALVAVTPVKVGGVLLVLAYGALGSVRLARLVRRTSR